MIVDSFALTSVDAKHKSAYVTTILGIDIEDI
jgi:hypothetical protein